MSMDAFHSLRSISFEEVAEDAELVLTSNSCRINAGGGMGVWIKRLDESPLQR